MWSLGSDNGLDEIFVGEPIEVRNCDWTFLDHILVEIPNLITHIVQPNFKWKLKSRLLWQTNGIISVCWIEINLDFWSTYNGLSTVYKNIPQMILNLPNLPLLTEVSIQDSKWYGRKEKKSKNKEYVPKGKKSLLGSN